jgi:hypothetical protein
LETNSVEAVVVVPSVVGFYWTVVLSLLVITGCDVFVVGLWVPGWHSLCWWPWKLIIRG